MDNQTDTRIGYLHPKVARLDLSSIHRKLTDRHEGPGWTAEECDAAEWDYRRFLSLLLEHPLEDLVPTETIDIFWHHHILDTRKYVAETFLLFGGYLHHNPYYGMNGVQDRQRLIQAFNTTKALYEKRFSLPYKSDASRCGRGCRNCGGRAGLNS